MWRDCTDIPGTYTHCPDATRDDTRVVGSSRVTGDCTVCATAQEKEVEEAENGGVEARHLMVNFVRLGFA